jgi:hypothetical protein
MQDLRAGVLLAVAGTIGMSLLAPWSAPASGPASIAPPAHVTGAGRPHSR